MNAIALLVVLLSIAADGPGGERPCVPLGADEHLVIDMEDVPLADVTRLVSCALELNLLLQPATLGEKRVTVIGSRPVDRRGLEALWRAVLADHDLVAERRGAYVIVRPARRP